MQVHRRNPTPTLKRELKRRSVLDVMIGQMEEDGLLVAGPNRRLI
jgi:hypothetical protein